MEMCKDQLTDDKIKLFASQILVHFALRNKSMKIIIQKGVLSVFQGYKADDMDDINNETLVKIKTNYIWIF